MPSRDFYSKNKKTFNRFITTVLNFKSCLKKEPCVLHIWDTRVDLLGVKN